MLFVKLSFNYVCITRCTVNIYYYLFAFKIIYNQYNIFACALFNNK